MRIYNSKTQKIEDFKPLVDKKVSMYVCGPTIYSDVHIGNTRPLIFFDVVARHFKNMGYNVEYVSNITDIDDKIINRALELSCTEEELVHQNFINFSKVCSDLRVDSWYKQPRVTQYIQEIILYIQKLIDMDFAYLVDGDVYFRVDKIVEYGEISKIILDQQQMGIRVDIDEKKDYQFDFVLWKKTKVGITWDAPFGAGRPGWHTECVVMINELLGDKIDIHGGGVDLKFPHHENENAQSRACGNDLANVWMHNGFINIDNEKMSKSIGNIINAKDLIKELGANVVRLLMMQTNYRQPINIDQNFINQTIKINEKFQHVYNNIGDVSKEENNQYIQEVNNFMSNDFNIANALSYMLANIKNDKSDDLDVAFLYLFELLGLEYEKQDTSENNIPEEVQVLLNLRAQAKVLKDFEKADIIRMDIEKLGYEIKDTRDGVKCLKIMKK